MVLLEGASWDTVHMVDVLQNNITWTEEVLQYWYRLFKGKLNREYTQK